MAIESGGGSSRSPYASLTQLLRSMLGSLYDDSPNDLKDEAALNMARLQIIAPPSASDRERIGNATPSDLRDWYAHALLNQGGRSSQPGSMTHGGVEVNFNDLFAGIEQQVRDDNIDRQTVQDVIDGRSTSPAGPRESGGGRTEGTGPTSPMAGATNLGGGTVSAASTTDGSTAGGSGGTGGSGGSGGGGWGGGNTDQSLNPDGTPRQIPGGAELWDVDGKVYLAYKSPTGAATMIWHVENPDRLNAIYGGNVPAMKKMTKAQLDAISPWYGGLSAELQNTSEDPWTQFMSDFQEAAKLRPWLNDPTVQAVMQGAYLEGRAPTQDELSQTDWWNEHTAAERAWLEQSVTMGRDEIARQRDDMARQVGDALRQAGINNAPDDVVKYIAEQSLTGAWSEQYASDQIRRLADPLAPGDLDSGLSDLINGVDLDTTREYENQVRNLMEEWLGPDLGRFNDRDVERWAGRLRNDPDGAAELEDAMRQQRKVILPGYNPDLTYRQIITPVENLATNIWGQPVQDSAFLVDLANTMDYTEIGRRLRSEGRKRGVKKVVNDALEGLGQTALGEQVVRSAV